MMPPRPLLCAAATLAIALAIHARATAGAGRQGVDLASLLERTAAYMAAYERDVAAVVAAMNALSACS
jgi:hypothetical protein